MNKIYTTILISALTIIPILTYADTRWSEGDGEHTSKPHVEYETGTNILLVSDQTDGVDTPEYFDAYYISALDWHNVNYTYWDHDTYGSPQLEDLEPYGLIIWFTGNSGQYSSDIPYYGHITLTLEEEQTLFSYLTTLEGDRGVLLSGMWVAWNCVADASTQSQTYSPLFSHLLSLDYPQDNFTDWIEVDDDWTLDSEQSSPIYKADTITIDWKSSQNYPDMLESMVDGGDAKWYDGGEYHHYACIHNEGEKLMGGKYRIALMSCPFEAIGTSEERFTVMGDILDWYKIPSVSIETESIGTIKTIFR
ncbi:MAG: hypothetical protein B6D57_03520 [Candidatus Coatesbacteria bacterium 4484_99]|uniref:Uncharacterized protein n=1 Tax=Candidatus Coatesbacteria bacterium 4484_99 TaxID=1970774 RepID=A0A1W9S0J3_9BACT|nr:MAG: hypothetical protein B6D57_03520 [Candidatus Coatesbacteria bacterium 4484_99]